MTMSALNSIAPTQVEAISQLAFRALVAGIFANFLNAALIGILL